MTGMQISDWATLFRLGRRRLKSVAEYTEFQVFQGRLVLSEIESQGVSLENKRVLDLGCGFGGYSLALAQKTDHVLAVDWHVSPAPSGTQAIKWIHADALSLPFRNDEFDLVICASLIEHVANPLGLLQEIRRVMTPQSICYLSFPPFYSPMGGHQFKPYHLLGEKLAIRLSGAQSTGYATAFGEWGLYPRTIRQVRRLATQAKLVIQNMSTRFLPVNLAALPIVGEFLTWHVEFLLSRESEC
jgi:ubiquinone/menaquinone biosynthesis C-methylase UbiE